MVGSKPATSNDLRALVSGGRATRSSVRWWRMRKGEFSYFSLSPRRAKGRLSGCEQHCLSVEIGELCQSWHL